MQSYLVRTLLEVKAERTRQDQKWGVQDHQPPVWVAILGEEAGEVAEAVLRFLFGKNKAKAYDDLIAELIQVAAVAVAFVECLIRNRDRFLSNETDKAA